MLGRIQAQARVIRGASIQIEDYAARAMQLPHDAGVAAARAVSANSGFMCAEGARLLADDIAEDMRELDAHWEDTAEVLEDFAVHWELADADTANEFEQIEARLNGSPAPDTGDGA